MDRRSLMGAGLAVAVCAFLPSRGAKARQIKRSHLRPAPGTVNFFGPKQPATAVWCYNGVIPGPVLRAPQGARLEVTVDNALEQETTIHWHGLRIPHAMDGVPYLTQPPIPAGGRFVYAFDLPDAGTFWYHPHVRGSEQQGRGLYGSLIVDEADPPQVDRDVTWVIDDWRLDEDGAISETFGNPMDLSHAGRLGNVATLNGRDSSTFKVRAGERLRLRLMNTANARIFAFRFAGHRPVVIALDGQPAVPHEPPDGLVILPPAGRADLIFDAQGEPGGRYAVTDDFQPQQSYRFLDIVYDAAAPLRESPLAGQVPLARNPIPEPKIGEAARHEILLGGGAMGGLRNAVLDGRRLDLRQLARRGKVWALNGIVAHRTDMDPLLVFQRGRTQVLAIGNQTAFSHPMHLHGHSFRLISRNGRPVLHQPWLDTVLLAPDDQVEVAFIADNPGDWLFHCHVLEHMEAGMSAVLRVA